MSRQLNKISFQGGLSFDDSFSEIFAEDAEDAVGELPEEGIVAQIFSEEDFSEEELAEDLDMSLEDALKSLIDGDESLGELSEELEELDSELEEIVEESGDVMLSDLIPGSTLSPSDLEDSADDTAQTDYANDKDIEKFIEYVNEQYPSKIPGHDGTTTTGCEYAMAWLSKLNSEISGAIRSDEEGKLDLNVLEGVRVNILRDVMVLRKHISSLKSKLKEEHSKAASSSAIPAWKNSSGADVDLSVMIKSAGTPNNIVIAVSPFERAISGMMINAHVSAGHPMEDVFEALKSKYDLTDREELSIMQICMDSGFPMFKDRGTISDDSDSASRTDFVKNYFA